MKLLHGLLAALVAALLFVPASVLAAPPKVVRASPDNDQLDVDPDLAELRIVFDQPMNPGGRSLVNSRRGLFPELVDKPRWENDRTFVWKVKLQPNTDYWLSINSTRFGNFRSKAGESAVPYPIFFRTGPRKGDAPAAPLKANAAAVARLRQAIDRDYSYRDRLKIDWDQHFKEFAPKLEAAGSPDEFASLAARMLAPAQDIHLTVIVGNRRLATYTRDFFSCFDFKALQRDIPGLKKEADAIFAGQLPDGARYLCIASLPADVDFLSPVYSAIDDAARAGKPLILDLRPNGGGDEITARKIAGCFIEKPVLYAKHRIVTDGKLSGVSSRWLAPTEGGPKFRGKLIVLTGPATCSSAEAFVLMLRQVPRAVSIGQRTAGSSGNPRRIDLGNGVSVAVPRWQAMRPDGTCFEGEGIAPDILVEATPADFAAGDPILAAAIKKLKE